MAKMRILLLFGGKSAEHEVSVASARSVAQVLSSKHHEYEIVPLYIDARGRWLPGACSGAVLAAGQIAVEDRSNGDSSRNVLDVRNSYGSEMLSPIAASLSQIDVVLPLIHGPNGEDGTLQGVLELAGVPYAGAGVLGSAVGMDKHTAKMVLKAAEIPVVDWVTVARHEWENNGSNVAALVARTVGYPCFVKPSNLGSSVGVHKVLVPNELTAAVSDALRYDVRVLVERAVSPVREIECAVLGNHDPQVSVCGEVTTSHEFYDYRAKYVDDVSMLHIPADLDHVVAGRVQELARRTFEALSCAGMARVDCFVRGDEVWVNEINTIPGFTEKSMYSKLWAASGMSYADLLQRLIDLAIERFTERRSLDAHWED
ncbi:MAG: D-alanine--D-alanine ligase [Chloroflexi bacterium]|nr:D-alanine--D-alanine ligase [Chloroflexota bacterium]